MTANERLAATKVELAMITDSWGLLDPDLKPYQLQISALVGSNTVLVAALESVLKLHKPDWSDWGLDHPDEGAVCSCGYNGEYEDCPTVEAINEALGVDL